MKRVTNFVVIVAVVISLAACLMAEEPTAAETTARRELPKIPKLNFTDTRLENGLRVIIAPEHTAPVYGLCIIYSVGSRNERPGRTGFAHLFEHMMFQGSENVGKGEHLILVSRNGGDANGTTDQDRTVYYETFPKNQLDLGLFLEADRMRSLAITQNSLDNQRNAVQEERRLRIDNQPYGRSFLEQRNLSYDNFAYKHSTIGSMDDLNAATVQDVAEFFRTYYAPNNAVLVIVGDLDPSDTLVHVKKYFGAVPPQPAPPAIDLKEPEHYGERREIIYDPQAKLPSVDITYIAAPGNTPDEYALQVLGIIFGRGASSRLYQRLVKEKQVATEASAFPDERIGPGLFSVSATPSPGVKPDAVEQAIDDEIATLQKTGVTDEEIDRARAVYLRQFINQRRSDTSTAYRLAESTIKFNDPNLFNMVDDKIKAVTAADVLAAARKYLVRNERTVILTLPADK